MRPKLFPGAILLLVIWLTCSATAGAEAKSAENHQMNLFHLDGISEDTARGDILYCMDIARPALSMRSKIAESNQYGLLGSLINGRLGNSSTDRMRNTVMNKCMVAHGYRLYQTDEVTWRRLLNMDNMHKVVGASSDATSIDAMATFASNPLPVDWSIR